MAFSTDTSKVVKNVNGYIHDLSEVQIGKTNGNRYFEFHVQESQEKFTRVACFSPEKRDALKRKQESKQPARLMNISPQKKKFKPDVDEYIMGKFSKVVDGSSLCFPWKSSPKNDKNPVSVATILSTNQVGDFVWFQGKVISTSKVSTVYSTAMKKNLQKCDVIVGDATGTIVVCVWENLINEIEVGKSYLFSEVKVSFFKKTFLNCTTKTVLSVTEEDIYVADEVLEKALAELEEGGTKKIKGTIVSAEVCPAFVCFNCNARIHQHEIEDAKMIVKCPSCKLSSLKKQFTKHMTANMVVQEVPDGEAVRFHCPMVVLQSVFEDVSKTDGYSFKEKKVTELSEEMVVETLLLLGAVEFDVRMEERLIDSMKLVPCQSDTDSLT